MIKQRNKVCGSSLVEFIITAPVLLGLGLGTVQAGLVYHGNSILNYATFEAARTGAVNNALLEPMMSELATRLAPLQGGDGSTEKAAEAIAKSRLETMVLQGTFTTIEILNPTSEAFDHFKVSSRESGVDVIPNSHLRHQPSERVDPVSGVNIQDANLLKIRVTHGFDLEVPGIGLMVGSVMRLLDSDNAGYYLAGKLPLVSVATVRMQSEVHGDSLRSASAPNAAQRPAENAAPQVQAETVVAETDTSLVDENTLHGNEDNNSPISDAPSSSGLCQTHIGSDPFLPTSADSSTCSVGQPVGASSPIAQPRSPAQSPAQSPTQSPTQSQFLPQDGQGANADC
jgi:hypothetical protein